MLGPKAEGVLGKHIEMQARGKGDKKIEIKILDVIHRCSLPLETNGLENFYHKPKPTHILQPSSLPPFCVPSVVTIQWVYRFRSKINSLLVPTFKSS